MKANTINTVTMSVRVCQLSFRIFFEGPHTFENIIEIQLNFQFYKLTNFSVLKTSQKAPSREIPTKELIPHIPHFSLYL